MEKKYKILITGSKGQLGNELQILKEKYHWGELYFHDIDTLDITDSEKLNRFFEINKPDIIVNCAAYTAVDKAEEEREKAFLINSQAVKNLVEASKIFNSYIIHISTDYVFDGLKNTPYIEDDAANPLSTYGKSKLEGELHLKDYSSYIILRTSWLYSSFGNNIVKTIRRLGKERSELKFVFDQVGSPTYAYDLADAIYKIIDVIIENNFDKEYSGIYHFSDEGVCSWYDFACTVIEMSNFSCKVLPIETIEYPTPAKRPAFSVFNKNKIKNTFGVEINWWKDSLKQCIKILEAKE